MKTWFTADTHFGHERIISLCGRPFDDVSQMNEAILNGINTTVPKTDRLVILGDVCLGKLDESLPMLSRIEAAQVVLVPGNHDRWSQAYHSTPEKREAFRQRYVAQRENLVALPDTDDVWDMDGLVSTHVIRQYEFCQLSDEWLNHPLDNAFFSHYPYEGDSHGEDRHKDLRPIDDGESPVIHGHVHTEWRIRGRQFNVGVDVNNFTPVSEDELAEWVASVA